MIHLGEHGTWATIPEAANHYNVEPVTIYAWTYRKNIRSTRATGRIHIRIDDIDAYLNARNHNTHAVESEDSR